MNSFNNTNLNSLHLYNKYMSSISHIGKYEQGHFIVTKSNIKFQKKMCKSLNHEHNHKFIEPNLRYHSTLQYVIIKFICQPVRATVPRFLITHYSECFCKAIFG